MTARDVTRAGLWAVIAPTESRWSQIICYMPLVLPQYVSAAALPIFNDSCQHRKNSVPPPDPANLRHDRPGEGDRAIIVRILLVQRLRGIQIRGTDD